MLNYSADHFPYRRPSGRTRGFDASALRISSRKSLIRFGMPNLSDIESGSFLIFVNSDADILNCIAFRDIPRGGLRWD